MNLSDKAERRMVKVFYEWTSDLSTPKDFRRAAIQLSEAAQQLLELSDELLEKSNELRIANQEESMWSEYRAELSRIAQTLAEESSKLPSCEEEDTDSQEVSGFSRSTCAPVRDKHLYPTGKGHKTSKDRRYCPTVKKTDKGKVLGKKGTSYSKLKMDASAQAARSEMLEAEDTSISEE